MNQQLFQLPWRMQFSVMMMLVLSLTCQAAPQEPSAADSPLAMQIAARDQLFTTAEAHEAEGRLQEAVALLLQVDKIDAELGLDYDRAGTASFLADIYERLENLDEARHELQKSLSILEQLASRPDAAEARWRLVDVRWLQKDFELRRTLRNDGLAQLEEAKMLGSEIFELRTAGRYREALPKAQRVLDLERSVYGREHPSVASCLQELGLLYRRSGDYYAAQDAWAEALDVRRRVLGEAHPQYGESLFNLGEISVLMARYDEAEVLMREARAVLEATRPVEHPDRIRVLIGLGGLQRQKGDLLAAEATIEEVRVHTPVGGGLHREMLSALANVRYELGDWAQANTLLEELEQVTRKEIGDGHADYSRVLQSRAALLSEMAEYARAEAYFERAAQILAQVTVEPLELASLHASWALLRFRMNDLAEAQRLQKAALSELEKVLPRNHPQRAMMLANLGVIMDSLGETKQAESLLLDAIEIMEDRVGEGHHFHTMALNNLATHYQKTNDLPSARAMLKRALGQAQPGTRLWALTRISMATIELATDELDLRASQELESAFRTLAEVTNPRHPDYCYALTNLATTQMAMARPTEATATFRDALDCLRSSLELAATVQSERQQLAMLVGARRALDGFLTVSGLLYSPTEDVYSAVLAWKGVVLARRLRFGTDEQDGELTDLLLQLQTTSARLAALARAPSEAGLTAWREELSRLSREREALQQKIARRSAAFWQQQSLQSMEPRQVLAALPEDAALIDFIEYEYRWPVAGARSPASQLKGKGMRAFVLRTGHPIVQVDLGPSEALHKLAQIWRIDHGLGERGTRGVKTLPTTATSVADRELAQRVWSLLAGAVGDARLIVLSPDGPTTQFPLGALPDEKTGGFLLEQRSFVWTPAAQILVLRNTERNVAPHEEAAAASPPNLVAVGAVDFAGLFRDLPASGSEAKAVVETFRATHPLGTVVELEGAAASEDALRRSLTGRRFVHLATHGFFAPPELRATSLQPKLEATDFHQLSSPFEDLVGRNPGLLSGIALAGAHKPPETEGEDGILTALELETLDLATTEMLVLSACETGLGVNAAGEGLLGLLRAAQAAGARSVVASLWDVPDQLTSDLMKSFYRNLWEKKMSRVEALRTAQLEILRSQPNPAAWGGWVLAGEWW